MGLLLVAEWYSSQQIAVIQDAVGQKCSAADEFTKVVVPHGLSISVRSSASVGRSSSTGRTGPVDEDPLSSTPTHRHRMAVMVHVRRPLAIHCGAGVISSSC